LRDRAPRDAKPELAVEDANYKELVLHSDIIIIADILVRYVFAPVAVGLIVQWIRKRLGSRFASARVRFNMTVDRSDDQARNAVSLSYDGPAKTFEATINQALAQLDGRDGAARSREPDAPRRKVERY
jgi:hypothetical protein